MTKNKQTTKNKQKRNTNSDTYFQVMTAIALVGATITVFSYKLEHPTMTHITIAITIALIGLCIAYKHVRHYIWKQRYLKSSLSDLDHLAGEKFEEYLAAFFENQGYSVKMTPKSHDYGADLIIKKNGVATVVQAKRYKTNVGVSAVQQIIAAKDYYHADACMVATNQYFTNSAIKLAKANHVRLLDREYFQHAKK